MSPGTVLGVPYTFQNGMAVFHSQDGYAVPAVQPQVSALVTFISDSISSVVQSHASVLDSSAYISFPTSDYPVMDKLTGVSRFKKKNRYLAQLLLCVIMYGYVDILSSN